MTAYVPVTEEMQLSIDGIINAGLYEHPKDIVADALTSFLATLPKPEVNEYLTYADEINRRWERYKSGEDEAVDGEEFFEELRIKYCLED